MICFHNGFVYDLLQLLFLLRVEKAHKLSKGASQEQRSCVECLPSYLEVVADHHLEHEKELAVGNEAVSIHIVHLECD